MIEIIVLSIVFLIVFYLIHKDSQLNHDREFTTETQYIRILESTTRTFMEKLAEIEETHFEQLEKQGEKQLAILSAQTKEFLNAAVDIAEAMKPVPPPPVVPHLLDNNKISNTIEEEEIPEQDLADMPRVPIVDGVKFKFEGEEEIYPFIPE